MLQFIIGLVILIGTYNYSGSKAYYLVFSVSYFALMYSAIKPMKHYSYLFLSVFLWLGFWLKFTLHTVFGYTYKEPIGAFISSSQSLDQLLLIASIGCWGVMAAYYLLSVFGFNSTLYAPAQRMYKIPLWYQKYRLWILSMVLLMVLVVAVLNLYFRIFQIGLVPSLILPLHLNGLLSWVLAIGFALIITSLMWWEVGLTKTTGPFFVGSVLEPLCNSISIFSRSLYIFHVIPVFLAWVFNHTRLRLAVQTKYLLAVLFLLGASFLISLQSVTVLRNYYYSGVAFGDKDNDLPAFVGLIENLLVGRWMGVEGVMAVSAYNPKNMDLLKQGLTEKAEMHTVGMYQFIAQAHYTKMDTNRFIFASLPGPVAFFFYSGSYWVVFLGMVVLTSLMMLFEILVFWLTENVFLGALVGMDLANAAAQFGVYPSMLIRHYLLIVLFCLFMYIITAKIKTSLTT